MLLSHPFHLELFSRGNGRESRAVLVCSQTFPKGISSHPDTKTHVHFQTPALHTLRAQECLSGSCCQLFQPSQLLWPCLPSSVCGYSWENTFLFKQQHKQIDSPFLPSSCLQFKWTPSPGILFLAERESLWVPCYCSWQLITLFL